MKILIVGGGKGGVSMIDCLNGLGGVEIAGVADLKADAPAMTAAKDAGIETYTDLAEALQLPTLDMVLDVTGSAKAHDTILEMKPPGVHVADPLVANLLHQISDEKGKANQHLQKQVGHMHEIVNTSRKNIDRIVAVIETGATQTKILGINAAIEAARAGEHGTGFGVVAQEVRNLADSSHHSARDIGKILGDIESSIRQVVQSMDMSNSTS